MSVPEIVERTELRERAMGKTVPVARLIGFEMKEIAEGRATVTLAAGTQHRSARPVYQNQR